MTATLLSNRLWPRSGFGTAQLERSRRSALLTALCSALVVVAVARSAPQGMYSDPGYQVLAAQQHLRGESPSANTLVTRNISDLSTVHEEWISWWAPGTTVAAYPLMKAGLSIGQAVRCIAIACEILGAVGWVAWFARFRLRPVLLFCLAVLFPWVHYGWNGMFEYSAETLLFGLTPWLMLGAAATADRWQNSPHKHLWWQGTLIGMLLGFAYVVKYSAVLAMAGVAAFLLFSALYTPANVTVRRLLRRIAPSSWAAAEPLLPARGEALLRALAVVAGFALPLVALNLINRSHGSPANLVSESLGGRFDWRAPLYALGNPALMLADADGLLRYLFLHPGHPLFSSTDPLLLVAVPAGLVLTWLVFHRSAEDTPALLAQLVFLSSVASILLIWTISSGVSFEARHVATAAMSVLPLALREGANVGRRAPRLVRLGLALGGICFVATPLLYGVVALGGKSRRADSGYRAGPAGIYNPLLASRDLASCREELLKHTRGENGVWYLTEPMSAIDLDVPAIIQHADFISIEQLRKNAPFATSKPLQLYLLLPPRFEDNGKGGVIRNKAIGVQKWERTALRDCEYILWSARLTN